MEEVWIYIALVLTGCVVVITYFFALVLKELAKSIKDLQGSIRNVNKITENVVREQEMIDEVLETVRDTANEVSESVASIKNQFLVPFTFVSSLLQSLRQYWDKDGEKQVK